MTQTISQLSRQIAYGRSIALKILKSLNTTDLNEKLGALELLDSLPPLPSTDRALELKEFHETKEIYKRLYTICARSIMEIIGSDFTFGSHDPTHSFNYCDPEEPKLAAEKIRFLPKAYMGGPIKAALGSPYNQVNRIAVNFYEALPHDIKYSGSFPDAVRKRVRSIQSI